MESNVEACGWADGDDSLGGEVAWNDKSGPDGKSALLKVWLARAARKTNTAKSLSAISLQKTSLPIEPHCNPKVVREVCNFAPPVRYAT